MIFSEPPIAPVLNAPEPSDADALRPPTAALKAEMARLDAEIAAGAVTLGATGEDGAESEEPPVPTETADPADPTTPPTE
jgi:hypothetical protein